MYATFEWQAKRSSNEITADAREGRGTAEEGPGSPRTRQRREDA